MASVTSFGLWGGWGWIRLFLEIKLSERTPTSIDKGIIICDMTNSHRMEDVLIIFIIYFRVLFDVTVVSIYWLANIIGYQWMVTPSDAIQYGIGMQLQRWCEFEKNKLENFKKMCLRCEWLSQSSEHVSTWAREARTCGKMDRIMLFPVDLKLVSFIFSPARLSFFNDRRLLIWMQFNNNIMCYTGTDV